MKPPSLIFLLLGLAAVSGCADLSSAEKERKLKDAQNVAPQNPQADILAFMRTYLNNPENVREAGISELRKLWVIDSERWAVCLRYNAKDNAGQYTGKKDRLAFFAIGKFDRLLELTSDNETLRPLRDYCASATYRPFPELERLRR
jgi:hypothetical protein